jgi:hypothetical protein
MCLNEKKYLNLPLQQTMLIKSCKKPIVKARLLDTRGLKEKFNFVARTSSDFDRAAACFNWQQK